MMRAHVAVPLCAALVAGCAIGPRYERPPVPISADWREGSEALGWKRAEPADALARGRWWERFGDRTLDELVARIDFSNQTVRLAEARLRQSRAVVEQQRAAWFPNVATTPTITRGRAASLGGGGSLPAANTFNFPITASWEADLWSRIRGNVDAATADALAFAADVESARLAAQSALAQNYFALRAVDAQRAILIDTVAAYERSLALTRNRYEAGVVPRVDIVQAEVQLKSAQAQLVDLGIERAQRENAIAILVGAPPASLAIPANEVTADWRPRIPDLPLALPSALLERRPDIASAERGVMAANARIGVAQTAFFPVLTFNTQAGFRASDIADWLRLPARFWSLGASLAQSLFDGGLRHAQTAQAVAAYDAEVADYRQTILNALAEVENQLAALRILEQEIRLQEEVVAGARQSVDLTLNQYRAGVTSFLNVISAQTIALQNERALVGLRARRLAAAVLLVQALGGGWDASELVPGTR